ncbi:PREDICTED: MAP7 domain-containing protein 3 isoform X2 [Galeopterus variegatus]|uniref:MAP7 domain-containing protein 3 isoform X2 n=1 Tax=Galeopterus variegatus TaxID=482537 RepID=A0ABM0RG10_GALVR|nr:PREDICTED: MAP7 domain-containing protein 3 isoform X2 [Galeopterus variegatus]
MADRVSVGGSTSLKGLRRRMVAAVEVIAEERRNQSGTTPVVSPSSNIRSSFKPVIDGSVLKNDVKQQLAKERREEKKKQQDATKEMQLLEKERKTKMQCEKQMEERQRKLRAQKEKDEQRRISAEKRRKQKLEEETEKYKAVLCRTLERSNRVDHRQKRWSWEGSANMTNDCKYEKKEKKSSSLNRRESKLHSSTNIGQVEEKPDAHHSVTNFPENNLISRLLIPTKASLARSKSAIALSVPGKDIPGITHIMQYVKKPLRSHSSDKLETNMLPESIAGVLPQTNLEVTPHKKVEIFLKMSVEAPAKASVEASSMVSGEASSEVSAEMDPKVSVEISSQGSMHTPPEVSVETFSKLTMEVSPKETVEVPLGAILEVPPKVTVEETPTDSVEVPEAVVEVLPEVSKKTSPEVNVDVSPVVNTDTSPDVSLVVSTDTSADVSPVVSSDTSLDVSPVVSTDTSPEVSMEVIPEDNMEASLEESGEAPLMAEMKDSPQTSEVDQQASNPVTKKRPSSHIPCYKWSLGHARRWHSSSPINTNRQTQKNRLWSSSSVISKQSAQYSLSYRVIPVQCSPFVQNPLGTVNKKRETVSETTNKCEDGSQRQMICEDPGNKNTPGTMSAEEATKILAERRRLVREQREKDERLQEEMETSFIEKVKNMATIESQVEEFLKFEDGQQQNEMRMNKGCKDHDDEDVLLQKEDAKLKAQEEADKRKKERERIMLQNLQERLERKKATEISGNDTYEEDEADDENETETDEDSFEIFPPVMLNDRDSSTKPKMTLKYAKKMPKLVFLTAATDRNKTKTYFTATDRNKTKTYFNCGVKNFRKENMKDPSTEAKASRSSTKRKTTRKAKTGKKNETNNTMKPSKSLNLKQEWILEITDVVSHPETSVTGIPPESHQPNLKESIPSCQSPQTPQDEKIGSKPVSAHSDI